MVLLLQTADTAYYDRLTETIVGVALVRPRKGVFQSFVRHLLVLCTAVEVVVLGVTYQQGPPHGNELITLLPEPVYQLPSDGIVINTTIGTPCGRIFQVGLLYVRLPVYHFFDYFLLTCMFLLLNSNVKV
jgi:nuclear pore complex protein Nup155